MSNGAYALPLFGSPFFELALTAIGDLPDLRPIRFDVNSPWSNGNDLRAVWASLNLNVGAIFQYGLGLGILPGAGISHELGDCP